MYAFKEMYKMCYMLYIYAQLGLARLCGGTMHRAQVRFPLKHSIKCLGGIYKYPPKLCHKPDLAWLHGSRETTSVSSVEVYAVSPRCQTKDEQRQCDCKCAGRTAVVDGFGYIHLELL